MTRSPRRTAPTTAPPERVTMLGSGSAGRQNRALVARTATEAPGSHYEAIELSAMPEKRFQALVVSSLRNRGWTVWTVPNMRMTTAGLPDLFCIHPDVPLVLLWELKAEKTRVTEAQKAAIVALMGRPGIDARIVRPSMWPMLRDQLDNGRLAELHDEALRALIAPGARAGGESDGG